MSMIETTDTTEDIDRLLVSARDHLAAFEDAVDGKRLLARIKRAAPAHPVLVFRAMFMMAGVAFILLAFAIMGAGFFNDDVAKFLHGMEGDVGVSGGLPVVCLGLSLLMFFCYFMATLAAHAIGRESPMLPWEAKEHQKLVNEVTRLTTQRAVMERIRGTPGSARPRIATPVPMSMRSAGPASGGFGGGLASRGSGQSKPPDYLTDKRASSPAGNGGFSRPPSDSSFGNRPNTSGFGSSPGGAFDSSDPPASGYAAPQPTQGSFPQGGFGQRPGGFGNSFGDSSQPPPAGSFGSSPNFASGSGPNFTGAPATPDFHASPSSPPSPGNFGASESNPFDTSGFAESEAPTIPMRRLGASTRGGTPLGANPRPGAGLGKPRLAAPMSFPGTPEPSRDRWDAQYDQEDDDTGPAEILEDLSYGAPDMAAPQIGIRTTTRAAPESPRDPSLDVGDIVETTAPTAVIMEIPDDDEVPARGLPQWGRIDEIWLEEAIEKAEHMVMGFPEQARLEFSKEDDLPFTLVIERATPAMAVRAMVSYVEFLASIYTPKFARIELLKVAHLDRSFHRNVDAALQPYFAGKVRVENNPGRVDIIFSDPDPGWDAYPVLPIQ